MNVTILTAHIHQVDSFSVDEGYDKSLSVAISADTDEFPRRCTITEGAPIGQLGGTWVLNHEGVHDPEDYAAFANLHAALREVRAINHSEGQRLGVNYFTAVTVSWTSEAGAAEVKREIV